MRGATIRRSFRPLAVPPDTRMVGGLATRFSHFLPCTLTDLPPRHVSNDTSAKVGANPKKQRNFTLLHRLRAFDERCLSAFQASSFQIHSPPRRRPRPRPSVASSSRPQQLPGENFVHSAR